MVHDEAAAWLAAASIAAAEAGPVAAAWRQPATGCVPQADHWTCGRSARHGWWLVPYVNLKWSDQAQ